MLFPYLEDVYLSFGKYLFHSLSTFLYHRQSDKRTRAIPYDTKQKMWCPTMKEIGKTPIFEVTSRSKIGG
jgi:hypothetical protein